jgi:hypothetical protein
MSGCEAQRRVGARQQELLWKSKDLYIKKGTVLWQYFFLRNRLAKASLKKPKEAMGFV